MVVRHCYISVRLVRICLLGLDHMSLSLLVFGFTNCFVFGGGGERMMNIISVTVILTLNTKTDGQFLGKIILDIYFQVKSKYRN